MPAMTDLDRATIKLKRIRPKKCAFKRRNYWAEPSLDGEAVPNRAFRRTIQIDEAQKSPQFFENVCSPRLRTWSGGSVVAFYRRYSGTCGRRGIEHHRPPQRFLTADWHTGFNVNLDARHDSAASARPHRHAARLFA